MGMRKYVFCVIVANNIFNMLKYKAIIFDLGGVIVNLDQEKTINSFKKLNLNFADANENQPIFKQYEIGKVSSETFIQTIKTELRGKASNEEIINAWNDMILHVSAESIETLYELKKSYKIFVLSNTNELHILKFKQIFEMDYPNIIWENLFDKIYYSHIIKHRKPNVEAWQIILNENNLEASETIFIDDTFIHYKAAETIGIKSILTIKPIGSWFVNEVKKLENL